MNKIKTPISYYGGKQGMLSVIMPKIPAHKVYTESFSGGLAVYWAKAPSKVEVINDLNGEIVNFYNVLKTEYLKLYQLVQTTLHSRRMYQDAYIIYQNPHLFDTVQRAWAFWVGTNQGFAAKIGSWGYDKTSGSKETKLDNQKVQFGLQLARRLEGTQIECNNALKIIQSRDSEDTFHYVDPPYVGSNCGHYAGYTESDYEELLRILSQIKGKFLLSSYDSELLTRFVNLYGWKQEKHDKQLSSSNDKSKRKVEVLTWNY